MGAYMLNPGSLDNLERSMTGKVVTITSGKGGVGKTTTVANIAVALASDGKKVVCIDGDIGLRNLDVIMGLENRIVYDIVDVVEGRCRTRQAMIRDKRMPELFLIPAAQTRDKNAVSPSDMVRLCDELRQEMDWILIDSPAGIERGFRNSIAAADKVLIVTNPEMSAVRDADRVIGLLEAEEKAAPSLIVNRLNPNMVKRGDMLSVDDVYDLLRIDVIGIVPEDENVIVASNRGTPLAMEAKSRAGQAFRNIARRLNGEQVPFLELESQSLWDRISRLAGRK
jgi:septum site-determining protein MinD